MTTQNLKPVPKNQRASCQELLEILPKKYQKNENLSKRKDLLLSIEATRRLKRSDQQGLIFVMGSSGVGKSSTINHLFKLKTEIARTNKRESETMETQEYLLQSDNDVYEVANLSLGIVDTPGFEDTNGTKQEACNMYSIKRFMKEKNKMKGSYPNLVLICFDATDVRFKGDSSNFAKLMKCLHKLKLVDLHHPNVVAVITKCCSLKPDYQRKRSEWIENIQWLMNEVKEIIEIYLHVNVPVVILENDMEEDLPRPKTKSGALSDFLKLPTGDLQPLNLYKACQDVLTKNNDLFGKTCFNNVFLNGSAIRPEKGFCIEARDAQIHKLDRKEKKLLDFLEDTNRSITKNEVKKRCENFIKQEKSRLTETQISEIREVAKRLNILGIFSKDDLKYVTLQSLSYHLNSEPSEIGRKFIQNRLEIKPSNHNKMVIESFSKGYNVCKDRLCGDIFDFSETTKECGLILPKDCEFTKMMVDFHFSEFSEDMKFLFAKRLEYLDLDMTICPDEFEYNRRPGFQMIKSSEEPKLEYYESWQFEVNVKNCKPQFSKNFKMAVDNLPSEFNETNENILADFFDQFGHFFILSAFGGGSYENSVDFQGVNGGHRDFLNKELNPDSKKKWIASIMTNPVILTTKMSLEPISSAVERIDKNKMAAVEEAMRQILPHQKKEEENPEQLNVSMTLENKETILTRQDAVKEDEEENLTVLEGILAAIIGLLAIGFFPITIIVVIIMKAKLG